ncbi:hypothetical protein DM860_014056 [Cuscuta australis]|uniref:Dof zinc finger protein n=1 Tax=Cuscuta australis TaxID=267555 RepID=A0A328DF80_9ASTE|nr:hypothetical protein DM860_014056 [Cuscuta australis]
MASQKGDHGKDQSSGGGGRRAATTRPQQDGAAAAATLKCPRCDSPNTKFCYFNNYSLSQPRHFCKTCRRYWTRGGALRSVPIGGGCRKNKKMMRPSSSARFSGESSSLDIGGFKLLSGLSSPAMDFQLAGLNTPPPPPALNGNSPATAGVGLFGHLSSPMVIPSSPSPCFNIIDPAAGTPPLLGFNFAFPCVLKPQAENPAGAGVGFQEMGTSANLASSIESLSTINQELHWKLQQQRLAAAMFFGGRKEKQSFQEIPKVPPPPEAAETSAGFAAAGKQSGGSTGTEWLFDDTDVINGSGENRSEFEAWPPLSSPMNNNNNYTSMP